MAVAETQHLQIATTSQGTQRTRSIDTKLRRLERNEHHLNKGIEVALRRLWTWKIWQSLQEKEHGDRISFLAQKSRDCETIRGMNSRNEISLLFWTAQRVSRKSEYEENRDRWIQEQANHALLGIF